MSPRSHAALRFAAFVCLLWPCAAPGGALGRPSADSAQDVAGSACEPLKSEQRKCLEACQREVGDCMKDAKDKGQKDACAEAAIACLRECGMGGPPPS